MHGHGMGTHGHGSRKKWLGSGHRGGKGMAGTGKRADHNKTRILALYGTDYFGKQGITSKGSKRDKTKFMNLDFIERNYLGLMKKFGKKEILELDGYKILGDGEITIKVHIKAKSASKTAVEKIKKAGGKLELIFTEGRKDKSEKAEAKEVKAEKKE
jgi:large subunit ribosomal protein L15